MFICYGFCTLIFPSNNIVRFSKTLYYKFFDILVFYAPSPELLKSFGDYNEHYNDHHVQFTSLLMLILTQSTVQSSYIHYDGSSVNK